MYYTPSHSRSQNTDDSSALHMTKRIRELEAENCHQRAQIEELTTQMVTKKSIYKARFWRLEALLLHGSSLSFVPEMAHPKGGNTKFGSPEKLFLLIRL
jgi:uncharacterized coiled-coil protein SlyX